MLWRLLLARAPGRFLPLRSPSIESVSCLSRRPLMHRLTNRFALAHTFGLRRDRPAAKSVKTSPLYDPTRLPSKGALLRLAPCGTRRARRGTWFPAVRARSAHGGFAATRPCAAPLHRDDAVLLCANTVVSARPLFTSANRIDADASLSQT